MILLIFLLYSILVITDSSKCPESRKPHSTSCTIFYNCVSLPGGGYVWVPSKCTAGLIFQPYLRMCVLPGDTWTCDTLSTESSIIANRYDVPDLINPNETSYISSTENLLNAFEYVDSSYTTDSIPDASDLEFVTPYPLIEDAEATENTYESNKNGSFFDANGYSQTEIENRKQYVLSQLIHHLLTYKEITIPVEVLATSSFSSALKPTASMPLSNYLIQNYIQQNNNLQNTVISGAKLENAMDTGTALKDNDKNESVSNIESPKSTTQTILDNFEETNSIILINDNEGNKQYVTIEKYKSLGYQVDSRFVRVIQCIKNVRLSNMTNCLKYYVCNPETAFVIEYSCPLFTAFNKYARTCDTESYSKCVETQRNKESINFFGNVKDIAQINTLNKNVCTEHGKTKDPTSEFRYYICYAAADNAQGIKSIRMTCPNGLIFCQSKKVCTTKRLCK